MCARQWKYWLVLLCCVGGFSCHRATTVQEQEKSLYQLGVELRDAIMQRDATRFAKLVSPEKREWDSIELGTDTILQREEFLEEMRTRRGLSYAKIFDTAQWQQLWGTASADTKHGYFTRANILSVVDLFQQAGSLLTIHPEIVPGQAGSPTYGVVHYEWPAKSKMYYADPEFVWTKYGWRMNAFFMKQ